MLLKYLLEDLEVVEVIGNDSIKVGKIEYDSEKIQKSDIFVAIDGTTKNGADYIEQAIANGAVALIINDKEKKIDKIVLESVTVIKVKNTRIALAEIAAKYYDYPATKLKIIGITGTKGKTTTAHMIRDILLASGKKAGMIGTIYNTYGSKVIEASRTTPESLDLQKLLREMLDNQMEYVVMEVSSHALALDRVHGIKYIVGVFTNLSREHLDFHETMEDYMKAKLKLFDNCDFALINSDDIYTPRILKYIKCKVAKFGLDNEANITGTDIRINNGYVDFKMYINKMLQTITVKIPGRYTVYNALAAIGVTSMIGCQMDAILKALSEIRVPGRSEVIDTNKTFTVLVDYAHNESSLEAILQNTRKYIKGRIICVFGCGGNRDKEKRTKMGIIAGKYSDFTVITTDNPRDEAPELISNEIEKGLKETKGLYKVIQNRKEAIRFAMKIAWKNDVIIIAGKGHETYQELRNKKRISFDERVIVKEIADEMPDKNIES